MPTLQTRLHSGVIPDDSASWRQRGRSAHLRQGSMDGACGPLAVFMSLVVLGVASRALVRSLRVLTNDRLDDTWIKSLDTFFLGTDDSEMVDLLKTLDRSIRHRAVTGSMRQVLDFTLLRLAKNEVVILGFTDAGSHGGHWVLAIGIEQVVAGAKRTPTGILCLDSAEPAPLLAPFNSRLDLDSPGRGARYLHYRLPEGGIRSVTCKTAIALSVQR
jgi:hypothetical protein